MAKEHKAQILEKEEEAPIQGDILEAMLSHVPLIHLLPASHVSKPWKRAVSSSLRHLNPIKPWLLIHAQTTRSPYTTTTCAYDPRSRVWIEINQPPIKYISALRSSHSTLLYMLSPSKFAFSFDPLHLTWHHVDAPLVWRTDPIVAVVDHRVIVAGGACDFQDDPLAIEIYDLRTRTWETCESMPAELKDSAASTWLSTAVDHRKMYAMEKHTGVTHVFDPNAKTWLGPYDLRPDRSVFFSVIGVSNHRLIMVGLIGDIENLKSVKVWKVSRDLMGCEEIGEMPLEMVEKLKGENCSVPSIGVSVMDVFVYIHNAAAAEEVVVCEIRGGGGDCEWGSVRNAAADDRSKIMERVVFTCSSVGLGDLQRALKCENRSFAVKARE